MHVNLDADGKKRLAAMKAALAAGLPLAGLLAGSPCAAADDAVPPAEFRSRGEEPARLAGEPVPPPLGSLVPPPQAECQTNPPETTVELPGDIDLPPPEDEAP